MITCSGKKFGHDFVGGVCLNLCGMRQDELSGKTEPVGENVLDTYLEKLLVRMEQSKGKKGPRNFMEETVTSYLKYVAWENSTIVQDMRLFWLTIATYYKSHSHAEMVRLLEWVKDKNCLHPKAVVKTFKRADQNAKKFRETWVRKL